MKERKCLIPLLLCLSMTLYYCKADREKVYPQYRSLTESVYSSVEIEPDSFYKAYAEARGIVKSVSVAEGDRVKEGEELLRIKDEDARLKSENAELQMKLATDNFRGKANLIQDLENELETASLKLEKDSLDYIRQRNLWDKQIGTKQKLEQVELAYKTSKNKVKSLENQLSRKKDELKTVMQQARNNYTSSLNQTADFIVRSKIKGKVYDVLKEVGESVNEQEPLAFIGSSENFIIKMQVDEVDIVMIREGQQIYVTLDAYENEVFEAEVNRIIPKMNQETQTFVVEGSFKKPPSVLYAGLRGEANIVIEKKEAALTVPIDFLLDGNQLITERGTLKVETGLRSLEFVEITDGLDTTTYVLKP